MLMFDSVLRFAYGGDYCHYWYMNRKFTMVSTSLLFVLPLCFPKRIDFLKYARLVFFSCISFEVKNDDPNQDIDVDDKACYEFR